MNSTFRLKLDKEGALLPGIEISCDVVIFKNYVNFLKSGS